MKILLGKKREMTQIFKDDGTVVPVTLVDAGPCTVTAVKTNPAGKTAIVLGFGEKKKIKKAQKGEWKELGSFELTREFPIDGDVPSEGAVFAADVFTSGDVVTVVGTSKGKGFQGVVKRHKFSGSPASHGHKDQLRMPGSIGAGGPQRVFKGVRMAGRMGGNQVTVQNLEIVEVNKENNTVAIKGAIPGARGSIVSILSSDGNVWQK
ncbi:MAG: 50S ribosomal protein L3 [bacterium]|nr:50S ribosomal protein L3 [bacterium]MDA1024364.1 50S ribosomal protein L3 [bacterium]